MRRYFYILIILITPWLSVSQSIDIGSGAVTTIGVGASISVGTASSSGTVSTNDATCLVIESTASGSGSLIAGGTPSATINSYISADEWHLVSPTTSGVTVNNYHFNFSPRSWLTYFDETASTEGDFVYMTELTDAVNVYQGYSFYVETTAQTVQYTGSLTSSDKILTTALSHTGSNYGWNLIGNPFPCALDYDGTWAISNVDDNVWVWDDSFGNYLAYSPNTGQGTLTDGIIPLGQGFFIHANTSLPQFTIPASARVHSTQAFYKGSTSTGSENPYVRLDFYNNDKRDAIFFGFSEEATTGFESGYDARKFFGPETSPQAFFTDAGMELSIDVHDTYSGEYKAIPFSYIPGVDGIQTLSVSMNMMDGIEIEIEDKQVDQFYDINEVDNLSFGASKMDDPNRFVLHLNRSASDVQDITEETNIQVFSYENRVYINQLFAELQDVTVQISDITGRNVFSKTFNNQSNIEIPIDSGAGYYIVTTIVSNKVKTSKVLIKK